MNAELFAKLPDGTIAPVTATGAAPPVVSPSGSLEGWSWREWLRRNKSEVKSLVAAIGAAASAWAATLVLPPWAAPLVAVIVGVVSRLGLDAVDYWLSDVPTAPPA